MFIRVSSLVPVILFLHFFYNHPVVPASLRCYHSGRSKKVETDYTADRLVSKRPLRVPNCLTNSFRRLFHRTPTKEESILIIGRTEGAREIASKILRQLGYSVEAVSNGEVGKNMRLLA
jgi:hypothetical protein